MTKFLRAMSAFLLSLALFIGLLCGTVYVLAGSAPYMVLNFQTFSDPAVTKVDPSEYPALAVAVTGYLTGRRGALQITVPVDGADRVAFSDRAIAHMADVRALLKICGAAALLCGLLVVLGLAPAFFRREWAKALVRGCLHAGAFLLLLAVTAAVWSAIDFVSLFTLFHRLLFTNDLWLLDPKTDLLLQLMPTAFFIRYARDIALVWAAASAVPLVASAVYLRMRKRKHEL